MRRIKAVTDIYPVFHDLFKKRELRSMARKKTQPAPGRLGMEFRVHRGL